MRFEELTTPELEARHRRLSEHFERACEERRLMAAASLREQLDAASVALRWRESSAAGAEAHHAGLSPSENPHPRRGLRRDAWTYGFQQARAALVRPATADTPKITNE